MITRIEYLVLSYVAELRISVAELFAPDIDLRSNLPHHSLGSAKLNALVHSLLQRDYLELLDPQSLKKIDAQTHPDLKLEGSNRIGLTTTGGQAWEEHAKPDWCLYLDIDGGGNELIITSGVEALILTSLYYLLPGLGMPKVSISRIGNWFPTYWKSINTGFQAKVTVSDTDPRVARIRHILENPWPPQIQSLCQLWRSRFEYSLLKIGE